MIQSFTDAGKIEVICGCMFSGKTEELIRRIRRAQIAKLSVIVFKPFIDSRYSTNEIVSHNNIKIKSHSLKSSMEIKSYSLDFDVIGIDEAQFFDRSIVEVCNTLANQGVRIIVAGLDMDYEGNPFGPMPYLMACAEEVTKVHAICVETGNPAGYSFRKNESNNLVLIGEKKEYSPLSREVFFKKMAKRKEQ